MRSLVDIADETARAQALHGRSFERAGNFEKLGILMEEVGEVAKNLVDTLQADAEYTACASTMSTASLLSFREERAKLRAALRAEIVQVASLAVRWVDRMDGEG